MQNAATIIHNSGFVVCCVVPSTDVATKNKTKESEKPENLSTPLSNNFISVACQQPIKTLWHILYSIQFPHTESQHPQIRPALPTSILKRLLRRSKKWTTPTNRNPKKKNYPEPPRYRPESRHYLGSLGLF